jgi:hypothetical protein
MSITHYPIKYTISICLRITIKFRSSIHINNICFCICLSSNSINKFIFSTFRNFINKFLWFTLWSMLFYFYRISTFRLYWLYRLRFWFRCFILKIKCHLIWIITTSFFCFFLLLIVFLLSILLICKINYFNFSRLCIFSRSCNRRFCISFTRWFTTYLSISICRTRSFSPSRF